MRIETNEYREVIETTVPSVTVTQFEEDKPGNKEEYMVSVQSVNDDWRSGYFTPITLTP